MENLCTDSMAGYGRHRHITSPEGTSRRLGSGINNMAAVLEEALETWASESPFKLEAVSEDSSSNL